jgi:histidine triad (HIT) family protein
MRMDPEVARAVDRMFPSDGLSVWHSAGAGGNQEVPHLHIHIHPQRVGDDLLRVKGIAPEA